MHKHQCLALTILLYDSVTVSTGSPAQQALPKAAAAKRFAPFSTARGKIDTRSPVSLQSDGECIIKSKPRALIGTDGAPQETAPPKLLQSWISLYRSLPKIHAPFTNLDVAFTIISAILFICMDYGAAMLIRTVAGWPAKETRAVAGSLTTIFHASVLSILLPLCLTTQRYTPSRRLESHPLWWQDASTALIQFCSGYMLYDTMIQLVVDQWVPGEGVVFTKVNILFMLHHVVAFLYMTSARLLQAGHMSALMLMFLGEATAPIMNLRRIANAAVLFEAPTHWLVTLRPLIEQGYAILYLFFRCVTGPVCAVHLTYDLLVTKAGRINVPVLLSVFWIATCWGIMIGSIPWMKGALVILGLMSAEPSLSKV